MKVQSTDGASENGRPVVVSEGHQLVLDVLANRGGRALPDEAVAPTADLLISYGLAGLGYTWAEEQGNEASSLLHALEPTFRRQQLAGAMVQESAQRALTALARANIPALVFKGAELFRSGLYCDVGQRPMDDADLLVPPDRAQEAAAVLSEVGFRPWTDWEEGRAEWSDSFSLRDSAAPDAFPCDIDLHWRTEYGSLRLGSGGSPLWKGCKAADHSPTAEAHLLVVAEHFLKHLRVRPHLLAYADMVRLCGAVESWDNFVRLARGRWWSSAIGVLLEVLSNDLGAGVPKSASARLLEQRPQLRRLAGALRPGTHLSPRAKGSRLLGLGQRWQLGPGSLSFARDVWGTVFPPNEWLRARYGGGATVGHRLRHGGALLRWASGQGTSPLSPNQESPKLLGSQAPKYPLHPVDTPRGRL